MLTNERPLMTEPVRGAVDPITWAALKAAAKAPSGATRDDLEVGDHRVEATVRVSGVLKVAEDSTRTVKVGPTPIDLVATILSSATPGARVRFLDEVRRRQSSGNWIFTDPTLDDARGLIGELTNHVPRAAHGAVGGALVVERIA